MADARGSSTHQAGRHVRARISTKPKGLWQRVSLIKAMPWRKFAQAFAIACVILVLVLSWTPGDHMRRTGLPGVTEHFVAYAVTAAAVVAALGASASLSVISLFFVVYAGLLELGQSLVPFRQPAWPDFLAGVLGSLAGSAFAVVLGACWRIAVGFRRH